jgi:hypothetical protein
VYKGGKLQSLCPWLPAREAAAEIADAGGDYLHDRARDLTPVGETGQAARSWWRSDVKRKSLGLGDAELRVDVENRNRVVYWLERGTKAHEIKATKAAALELPMGERESAHVRGIQGRHMLGIASAEAEAHITDIARPALEKWGEKTEREAKSKPGVE